MIGFLIRRFIANYDDVKDTRVREAYGVLSGALGIVCNLLLFLIKLGTGLVINSIAVLSDAFNNLTDLSHQQSKFELKLSSRPMIRTPWSHAYISVQLSHNDNARIKGTRSAVTYSPSS